MFVGMKDLRHLSGNKPNHTLHTWLSGTPKSIAIRKQRTNIRLVAVHPSHKGRRAIKNRSDIMTVTFERLVQGRYEPVDMDPNGEDENRPIGVMYSGSEF